MLNEGRIAALRRRRWRGHLRAVAAPRADEGEHVLARRHRGPRAELAEGERGGGGGELHAAREGDLAEERGGEGAVEDRAGAVRVEDVAREGRAADDLIAVAA